MGFLLMTTLVSAVAIFVVSSLLHWVLSKAAPSALESLGHVAAVGGVVALTTVLYVFVMTRPSVIGPYEQWTFSNIGGQLFGGVLAGGLKIWLGAEDAPEGQPSEE